MFVAVSRFSPTCFLDSDGQATCSACPAGHTGRHCERFVLQIVLFTVLRAYILAVSSEKHHTIVSNCVLS